MEAHTHTLSKSVPIFSPTVHGVFKILLCWLLPSTTSSSSSKPKPLRAFARSLGIQHSAFSIGTADGHTDSSPSSLRDFGFWREPRLAREYSGSNTVYNTYYSAIINLFFGDEATFFGL